ncbi:MAG: hypothetical protein A2V57_00215 [Candidatus Aminicenantes bacterium RBG_19FT_COMBO_65_30]|nr:MAG: hypothetical protein A2V57_00215 [Candidatus Aminicenantes bacterium RBG_19FT_COMBO_65_30]
MARLSGRDEETKLRKKTMKRPAASADYYWDLSGSLETSRISASPLGFRTQSGERLGFSVVANRDVLPYDFEIAEGVVLPAGPYSFMSCRLDASSANHRPIVFDAGYNFGEFYSGRYDDVNLGLTLKFKGYATLAFDMNLVRARLRWQITPGNEIYLVYNRNWERRWDPMSRFASLGERGVVKISLSIRP